MRCLGMRRLINIAQKSFLGYYFFHLLFPLPRRPIIYLSDIRPIKPTRVVNLNGLAWDLLRSEYLTNGIFIQNNFTNVDVAH